MNENTYLSTGDNEVFRPVLDLNRPVWVPHGQIARVEVSAVERASRRVGILEVALHDDVPAHDDLADRLAVAGDVDELFAGLRRGANDAERERGREGVSLASDEFGPPGGGKRRPCGLQVVAGERPISLAVAGSEWQRLGESASTYVRPYTWTGWKPLDSNWASK